MDIGLFVPDVLSELNYRSVVKPLKHKRKYFECKQMPGVDLYGGCTGVHTPVGLGQQGCKGVGKNQIQKYGMMSKAFPFLKSN